MAGENSYTDIPEFFPGPSSGMTAWKMSVESSFVMVNSKAFKIEMYLQSGVWKAVCSTLCVIMLLGCVNHSLALMAMKFGRLEGLF